MKSTIKNLVLASAVLVSAASTLTASAFERAKSNFIVQPLSTKAEFAQNSSQDLLLRADEHGTAYLYVEQQQGALARFAGLGRRLVDEPGDVGVKSQRGTHICIIVPLSVGIKMPTLAGGFTP